MSRPRFDAASRRLPAPGWIVPRGELRAHYFIPRPTDAGVARSLCLKFMHLYQSGAEAIGTSTPPIGSWCVECSGRRRALQ